MFNCTVVMVIDMNALNTMALVYFSWTGSISDPGGEKLSILTVYEY